MQADAIVFSNGFDTVESVHAEPMNPNCWLHSINDQISEYCEDLSMYYINSILVSCLKVEKILFLKMALDSNLTFQSEHMLSFWETLLEYFICIPMFFMSFLTLFHRKIARTK